MTANRPRLTCNVMSEKRKQVFRVVLGVLFSPLIGLLAGLVVLHLRHPEGFGWLDDPVPRPLASLVYLCMFAIWAYPGMIILGIPTHIWFEKRNWTSTWQYCLAGLVGGILTIALVINAMLSGRPMSLADRLRLIPFGVLHPSVVGLVTGLAFWMIAVRRRHNRVTSD